MRKELSLPYSIISFENLKELISNMEEYIDLHQNIAEKYGDRLGYLLRRSGSSGDAFMQTSPQTDTQSDSDEKPKAAGFMGGKKRTLDERGWVVLGTDEFTIRVATGTGNSLTSSEISVLFKIVEQLKAKIASLQLALRLLSELPTKGFRADQRLLVVFKDGLPKQVIPTGETSAEQKRFRYLEQFQTTILK